MKKKVEEQDVTALDGGTPPMLYMGVTRAYTAPNGDWLVQGRAINETVHQHGTIKTVFDYPSAKRAFETWRGNVREQHDVTKAVATGIDWTPNDAEKAIDLVVRVSKGSSDTWHKLNDNVLTGFSVNLKQPYKATWETINNERVLRYSDYEFAEISLVDAPGIPGCNVSIVRADGSVNDEVVDITEAGDSSVQAVEDGNVERKSVAISKENMSKIHTARDSALSSARAALAVCPCPECASMANQLDPDQDGDVDLNGVDADDGAVATMTERVLRRLMPVIVEQLQPSVMRYQAIAGDLSRLNIPSVDLEPVQRAIAGVQEAVTASSSNTEVVTRLDALDGSVKRLEAIEQMVRKIHDTPMPGGPVLRSADKRLITDTPQTQQAMSDAEVTQRAAQLGIVDARKLSPQGQVNLAYNAMQPIKQ